MPFTYVRRAALALALFAAAGCTVKNTEVPPLTGPSGLALTLTVNASPGSLNQNGGDQSVIRVLAIGPDGRPAVGVPMRLDMKVRTTSPAPCSDIAPCFVSQDFGSLSARSIVSKEDGAATAIYTAPPGPVDGVFGICSGLPGNCVSIVATPTATNFMTSNPEQVLIRLVPTGIILPPASTPTAAFTFSPTPVTINTPVIFDASTSCGGPLTAGACASGGSAITGYAWNFGDGTSGSGATVTHTFSGSGTSFNVSLTVTNDRGASTTTTQTVGVSVSPAPSGDWVFSPTSPNVNETVLFNADALKAATGHTLVQFSWNFGDPNTTTVGNTASGFQASHIFTSAGTYTVVLSVADETGQKTVLPKTVIIGTGNPVAVLLVSKTGGNSVQADGSGSSPQNGSQINNYTFNFGDGTAAVSGTSSVANHTYAIAGTYTVRLTVTDSRSRSGTTTSSITVP